MFEPSTEYECTKTSIHNKSSRRSFRFREVEVLVFQKKKTKKKQRHLRPPIGYFNTLVTLYRVPFRYPDNSSSIARSWMQGFSLFSRVRSTEDGVLYVVIKPRFVSREIEDKAKLASDSALTSVCKIKFVPETYRMCRNLKAPVPLPYCTDYRCMCLVSM